MAYCDYFTPAVQYVAPKQLFVVEEDPHHVAPGDPASAAEALREELRKQMEDDKGPVVLFVPRGYVVKRI